jgi:hypothetical protein
MQLQGRQTQFYIDLIYGLGFAAGFGYLLIYGMNLGVAAFSAGLIFGYFLRVWEKMIVYERILHEEVAAEAEEVVAAEAEEAVADEVTAEVEKQVPEEMSDRIEEQFDEEMDERFEEEFDERVAEEVEEQIDDRSPAQRGRRKR